MNYAQNATFVLPMILVVGVKLPRSVTRELWRDHPRDLVWIGTLMSVQVNPSCSARNLICLEPAMYFFGIFASVIAAIMLLINMVSLCLTDKNTPPGKPDEFEVRNNFWRNQRSGLLFRKLDLFLLISCSQNLGRI